MCKRNLKSKACACIDHAMTLLPEDDLQALNLTKRFGAFTAVHDLSFSVVRGSFFSILGPSGCGKTTLLRMIAGFQSPDEGQILIRGKSMQDVAPNKRPVNMVFQHLALFPMMSVGENVAYGLVQRGVGKSDIKRRVGEMLERVGLPGAQERRIEQMSGGQKQRVAIARSLVLEPTLLLLDEPLGALDLKLREHMKVELKQLQAAFGTTFVYITHDQSEALVMSDKIAVMHKGSFEQVGTPQQLYYQPQTPFVAGFVGANNCINAKVIALENQLASLVTLSGLPLRAMAVGSVAIGDEVNAFIRPEVATIARQSNDMTEARHCSYVGKVESILFDGANSAVLLREHHGDLEFRIALPQNGQLHDLKKDDLVNFGFDPYKAVCFARKG
jgi:spermidine/putrescine transport system ATP-binding protein